MAQSSNSPDNQQALSPDGVLLARLAEAGSNLSKLHSVEFLLLFTSQKAAERASNKLVELAFATKTEPGKSETEWVVHGTKRMYPVESDLRGLRDKLTLIATEEDGVYFGWRAVEVK
jgi:hypothetical protein